MKKSGTKFSRFHLLLSSQEDNLIKEIKVIVASNSTLRKQQYSHTLTLSKMIETKLKREEKAGSKADGKLTEASITSDLPGLGLALSPSECLCAEFPGL